ncbi:MAG: response regulator [Chloroflexi bacterium]|nr:response regulator [Chloroflexota bacterium]
MSRILYIEDDANNRVLVSRVFKVMAPDFVYFEAATAQAGIQIATEQVPDLILMDISMPDMDGLTATAQIRKLEGLRKVPIIALTANAMEGDKERFIAAGCDGYISKPIDIDTFVDTVREFLTQSAQVKALESSKDGGAA